jgi:hypothetical protein
MHLDRQSKLAEAEFYKRKRMAEANEVRLSAAHISHRLQSALAATPKTFFGKSITDLLQVDSQLAAHLATLQTAHGNSTESASVDSTSSSPSSSATSSSKHHYHRK